MNAQWDAADHDAREVNNTNTNVKSPPEFDEMKFDWPIAICAAQSNRCHDDPPYLSRGVGNLYIYYIQVHLNKL